MIESRKDAPGSGGGKPDIAGPDIAGMSFEQAMDELDQIVRQIEEGRGALDEAITAYERGVRLQRHCDAKLKQAEARIEKITMNAEGGLAAKPFDD